MANNGNNLLAAVIVGATAGAITALLLAPDKGERTRKKLIRKLKRLNEDLEDLIDKSKDSFQELSEDAEDSIDSILKKGRKLINN